MQDSVPGPPFTANVVLNYVKLKIKMPKQRACPLSHQSRETRVELTDAKTAYLAHSLEAT